MDSSSSLISARHPWRRHIAYPGERASRIVYGGISERCGQVSLHTPVLGHMSHCLRQGTVGVGQVTLRQGVLEGSGLRPGEEAKPPKIGGADAAAGNKK